MAGFREDFKIFYPKITKLIFKYWKKFWPPHLSQSKILTSQGIFCLIYTKFLHMVFEITQSSVIETDFIWYSANLANCWSIIDIFNYNIEELKNNYMLSLMTDSHQSQTVCSQPLLPLGQQGASDKCPHLQRLHAPCACRIRGGH